MTHVPHGLISIVVPVFNEMESLGGLHEKLTLTLESLGRPYEIVYVDDGSTDNSRGLIASWHMSNSNIRLIRLSRNFGKESALAAGITEARGEAIIMLDADGQHPVEKIPDFIRAWQDGAQVVIGLSDDKQGEGTFKRIGSRLFYKMFNKVADQPLVPGATDYRLIDKEVQQAFLQLNESDRITRGLIDWLGFNRAYIPFTTNPREHGTATYNRRKLMSLAANSFVSLTSTPMYLFGYLGIFITAASFLLGATIIIEQLILEDPLNWNFTGTAMLGVLIIFLVGLVLLSQGILSLYVSHIHTQSKQRPLFVINRANSVGLDTKKDA
jgi:polyisoprenyl-phosphate glycosyltransferase